MLEAVTKDQLNTGLTGQIRYRVSESNLYAYLFGVKRPIVACDGLLRLGAARAHRQLRGAGSLRTGDGRRMRGREMSIVIGVSINDLRKNLRDLNEQMDRECVSSAARYGIILDASLITGIDPPHEVESALAAINTAHNQVSSDISLAQASADQKIVQSHRAVEIETLKAQAEVEPLKALAAQLRRLQASGPDALRAYLRNVRLRLYTHAQPGHAGGRIMDSCLHLSSAAFVTFFAMWFVVPIFLFGLAPCSACTPIVQEGTCQVYVLFGKVDRHPRRAGAAHPALRRWGLRAFIVSWLGSCQMLDMRLDQQYLRSQPVNSEEGAPMGMGIWYEMFISDPVSYLFKNADPRGSLAANVSNAVVRSLSNMPLDEMLVNRHTMSRTVREEVSPHSHEWGYKLGSVYIRKVHFRDDGMTRQIEEKVVNRLRQVTSAIKQDGANQVSIITSTAERQAAIEFAKAGAMRPRIVGEALKAISADPEVANALFEILETQKILDGKGKLTLVPKRSDLLNQLIVAEQTGTNGSK